MKSAQEARDCCNHSQPDGFLSPCKEAAGDASQSGSSERDPRTGPGCTAGFEEKGRCESLL